MPDSKANASLRYLGVFGVLSSLQKGRVTEDAALKNQEEDEDHPQDERKRLEALAEDEARQGVGTTLRYLHGRGSKGWSTTPSSQGWTRR